MITLHRSIAYIVLGMIAFSATADEFDSNGVKIHYTVQGKGEPVILIHGLYSSAKMNWDMPGITAALAKRFQVVTLDCRGHGQSGKPQAEGAYGTNMVEDVVRLMERLKIPKARVVGYSMGGMIGMKLTVTHPERVSQLVLGGMGWHKAAAPTSRFWEGINTEKFNVPPACAHQFPELSVTEAEIKVVKILVTMIVGDADPCRKWYVEPLHEVRPEWPVHVIAGAGHLNCVTKPEFKAEVEAALGK